MQREHATMPCLRFLCEDELVELEVALGVASRSMASSMASSLTTERERERKRETRAPTRARDERDERLRLPLKKGEDNKDEFLNRSLQTHRFHCVLSMMKIQV